MAASASFDPVAEKLYGTFGTEQGDGFYEVELAAETLPDGYVNPAVYDTVAYTTPHADDLARNGFLVIHPNYRNHPPSESGDNRFRVGYAIDVLNLVGLVALPAASPDGTSAWSSGGDGVLVDGGVVVGRELHGSRRWWQPSRFDRGIL